MKRAMLLVVVLALGLAAAILPNAVAQAGCNFACVGAHANPGVSNGETCQGGTAVPGSCDTPSTGTYCTAIAGTATLPVQDCQEKHWDINLGIFTAEFESCNCHSVQMSASQCDNSSPCPE